MWQELKPHHPSVPVSGLAGYRGRNKLLQSSSTRMAEERRQQLQETRSAWMHTGLWIHMALSLLSTL